MKRDFVDVVPKLVLTKVTGRGYDDQGNFYQIKWDGKQHAVIGPSGNTILCDGFIAVEDVLVTQNSNDARRISKKGVSV